MNFGLYAKALSALISAGGLSWITTALPHADVGPTWGPIITAVGAAVVTYLVPNAKPANPAAKYNEGVASEADRRGR